MTNLTADLIARIERRRTETKNPCKSYATEASANAVAEKYAQKFADYFALSETQRPCGYIVAFDAAWQRWVIGFDLGGLLSRPTSTGGYVGCVGDAGFYSY